MYVLIMLTVLMAACSEEDDSDYSEKAYIYSFNEGLQGWEAGFADYVISDTGQYELKAEHAKPPIDTVLTEIGGNLKGSYLISGNNVNGALFMYLQRKVDSLLPNTEYLVSFDVRLISDAPRLNDTETDELGSVFIKAGALSAPPEPVEDGGNLVLDIDKGSSASEGGDDLLLLGDIRTNLDEVEYAALQRDNAREPARVTTNEQGEAWILVGTDSEYGGTTTLYYYRIRAIFRSAAQVGNFGN